MARVSTLTNQNRNRNSILLRLPREIISIIFQSCGMTDTDSRDCRLVTASICRALREIAFSTPRMWNTISVRLSSDYAWQPLLVKQWLDRSGALPLSVEVYHFPRQRSCGQAKWIELAAAKSYAHESQVGQTAKTVNAFSPRWQSLAFTDIPTIYYDIFRGDPAGAPSLRDLVVHARAFDSEDGKFMLVAEPPAPTSVSLDVFDWTSRVVISWKNVTTVRLGISCVAEPLGLLERLPTLQVLYIENSSPWTDFDPSEFAVVKHNALQELVLDGSHMDWEVEDLLNCLELPALQCLRIEGLDDEFETPFSELVNFVDRSACRLKRFSMTSTSYDNADLISFLNRIPSLEALELSPPFEYDGIEDDWTMFPDALLKRLAETSVTSPSSGESSGNPGFLPRLQSLTFNAHQTYRQIPYPGRRFPWDIFLAMFRRPLDEEGVQRRPLNKVELIFDARRHMIFDDVFGTEDTVVSLLQLSMTGVDLYIHPEDEHTQVDMLRFVQEERGIALP